jgi:aryl-alcohol dehydrogenase-like predicted oxidoreductase
MHYRTLGRTTLRVSELCLGTMTFRWTCSEADAYDIMDAAFAAGINFFDTADVYSRWAPGNPGGIAEEIIGKWMQAHNIPRDQIVIATKVRGRMWDGPDGEGLSRAHILRAVEDSLRRLQIEQIDLYQSHAPDENTPQEETLRAFDDLIQHGKVRFIGCSNFTAAQLRDALDTSARANTARYDTLQPHYNLIWRGEFESELETLCAREQLGVIPYSPLQGGFLTGKYKRGAPIPANARGANNERVQKWMRDERALHLLDTLAQVSRERGESMTVTALAWLLTKPAISSAIIGANNVAQLNEALAAAGKSLHADEKQLLDSASEWS